MLFRKGGGEAVFILFWKVKKVEDGDDGDVGVHLVLEVPNLLFEMIQMFLLDLKNFLFIFM